MTFMGEKYGAKVDDVTELVKTRPWAESMKGKSIVEIENAAAVIFEPERCCVCVCVYVCVYVCM
jgi:hypothetical protein